MLTIILQKVSTKVAYNFNIFLQKQYTMPKYNTYRNLLLKCQDLSLYGFLWLLLGLKMLGYEDESKCYLQLVL